MTDARARHTTESQQEAAAPQGTGTGVDEQTSATQATPEEPTAATQSTTTEKPDLEEVQREGLEVESRSVWRVAWSRFLRHKLAMGSLILLLLIFAAGIFAPLLTPYGFAEQDLFNPTQGPTVEARHFFGTDQLGRDYFTRVLFGIRTTVRVALIVAVLSTLIGTVVGAIAGYFGGWVDNALMRLTDLILTLPSLAVLLVAAALLGNGIPERVAIILALIFWTQLARIIRGVFLSLREKEYVEAAKALGATDIRIIFRHMLPNAVGPVVVNATLVIATAILVEAVLSFLGFGVQPPTPALGQLIDDGKGQMLQAWWLVVFPGITIVLICLCINFLGDGLRDALDPTQRRTSA